MKDLGKTFLFRMTHIENIPHILQHGIVRLSSATADPGFVPIGDSRVIDVRKKVLLKNGQTLGEYIPFYFGPRMPMLYVIQNGFNSVPKLSAEKIVYCLSSVQKIEDQKLDYIFTDGHALSILTTYYDRHDIAKINELVDWEAVRVKYWTNDSDLKRRKEAEFLVSGDIPLDAILGFVVFNEAAAQTLKSLGIPADRVLVRQDFYF